MASHRSITVFVSYAHQDEDHHRRLAEFLRRLEEERKIDAWDDRAIQPGTDWGEEIAQRLREADIILLLVSENFLASKYVRDREIPEALKLAETRSATLVPVILEPCDWQSQPFARWQAMPPKAAPVSEWPDRDSAYALVAQRVGAIADSLRAGVIEAEGDQRQRQRQTVYRQYPFRLLGEDYDPFRAFEQVFRRVETGEFGRLPPLPLRPLGDRVEFVGEEYQTILSLLRHSGPLAGLPYDLAAIPYPLLGQCVERGLIQPLNDRLREHENDFLWWSEMGTYEGRLYGVPLSALTMVLAVREDLLEANGLPRPDRWEDYLGIVDAAAARPIVDGAGRPVAPDLLQGRRHVAIWYDWLNHLYACDANDREIYGDSLLAPDAAAETLRQGTLSYLSLAGKLARHADGRGEIPHYAVANWDDGIEQFARGRLLMHFLFTDALETLRLRMQATGASGDRALKVRFLPMPRAAGLPTRHGHVEGWVLCVPSRAHYPEAANDVLDWFLDLEVQRAYALWGGASAHRTVIEERTDVDGGGAGRAFWQSVEDQAEGRASVGLVKYKGPGVMPAVERVVANLYDAVLAVARGQQSAEQATHQLIWKVAQRLLRGLD